MAQDLAAKMEGAGELEEGKLVAFKCDLRSEESIMTMFAEIKVNGLPERQG